jgi:hypothetical protein
VVGVRYALLTLVLAVAACGSSSAEPAPSHAGTSCGPAAARTLAADRAGRVYRRAGTVYACSSQTGRIVTLGQSTSCLRAPRVSAVALAGTLVAYGSQTCGVDTGAGALLVRRLSDGGQLHRLAAVSAPAGPESYRSVVSVVLRPNGSVAWIGSADSVISHRTRFEVHALSGGAERRLDQGTRIEAHSLRLHGSRLMWSDDGQARSATLR